MRDGACRCVNQCVSVSEGEHPLPHVACQNHSKPEARGQLHRFGNSAWYDESEFDWTRSSRLYKIRGNREVWPKRQGAMAKLEGEGDGRCEMAEGGKTVS